MACDRGDDKTCVALQHGSDDSHKDGTHGAFSCGTMTSMRPANFNTLWLVLTVDMSVKNMTSLLNREKKVFKHTSFSKSNLAGICASSSQMCFPVLREGTSALPLVLQGRRVCCRKKERRSCQYACDLRFPFFLFSQVAG